MSIPPGTYTITYQVTAGEESDMFTIDLIVPDPCDPPSSLEKVDLDDQSYILTDINRSYTHPDFVVSPDFCPIDYTYQDSGFTISDIGPETDTVITREGQKFNFFWDTNRRPLGQTQVVTVTGVSNSIYGPQ